jgi:hypothetical protein
LHLTNPRDDEDCIAATKGGLFRGTSNWILDHDDFRRCRDTDDARLRDRGQEFGASKIRDNYRRSWRSRP